MNFAFLAEHDAALAEFPARAELYCFDDPNAALVKLRQWSEMLAQRVAAEMGAEGERRQSQHRLLQRLEREQIVDASVVRLFHLIRSKGTVAVHEFGGESATAVDLLRVARRESQPASP